LAQVVCEEGFEIAAHDEPYTTSRASFARTPAQRVDDLLTERHANLAPVADGP